MLTQKQDKEICKMILTAALTIIKLHTYRECIFSADGNLLHYCDTINLPNNCIGDKFSVYVSHLYLHSCLHCTFLD